MADIDKALPNERPEEEVAEEVNVEEFQDTGNGPVEITEDEEGATIDFDPSQVDMPEDGGDHSAPGPYPGGAHAACPAGSERLLAIRRRVRTH